jgi:hypothetical protein
VCGERLTPDLDFIVIMVGEVLVELLKVKLVKDVLHDGRGLDDTDVIPVPHPSHEQVTGITLVFMPRDDVVEIEPAVSAEFNPAAKEL